MPPIDQQYLETMISNMPEKTGKTLDEWKQILNDSKLEKHGEMLKLLKTEYGVTHGFANTIAMIYRENAAGGPVEDEQLVRDQYEKKANLKPWYDQILQEVIKFGSDVGIAPKKKYVSLRRNKQFAILQPSTSKRMDIGLNLKGEASGGILIDGDKWSGMCSHRIEIHKQEEITPEVVAWLKKAYDQAGT